MRKFTTLITISLSILVLISSCRKRDAIALPDNYIQFEASEQGMGETTNTLDVKVRLSRPADSDIPVDIALTTAGVVYATDFNTVPAANANNHIALTIPRGSQEATIQVKKATDVLLDGDESIDLKIQNAGSPLVIGSVSTLKVKFEEIIAASSALVANGGGATYGNKVFIDLSASRQTPVERTKWDLGFYTAAGEFKVVLNSSAAMMAKQINKNDLSQVSAADTVGFSTEVMFNQLAPTTTSLGYIDYPNGDLNRTAIATISADAAENKVYIINRGTGIGSPAPARGWKKVRILRNATGGYTLQHADIAATTFQEIQISKDEAYFFKYISFENGNVAVEPEKNKWDISWTYFSNVTNFGGGEVPYLFQDIVIQNRNVQVAKVMTSAKAYADFAEADLATLTFVSTQNGIGSDWRSGGGPTSGPAVRTDRYYIVKDGEGNYYKLRFTALTQNGERGYPAMEFSLVKRG